MLPKNRIMPFSAKRQETATSSSQDDAWLNDAGPLPQTMEVVERVTEEPRVPLAVTMPFGTREQQRPGAAAPAAIVPGQPLWWLVLRLSERIWQELFQKQEFVAVTEAVQEEYVRQRTLDLLRSEPKMAQRIRDLAEGRLVVQSVVDEVCGYGPLTALMQDDRVREITVVGPRFAYVERDGTVEDVQCRFEDERHMLRTVENILRKTGRRINSDWPLVDVRLPDGSLVNIVLPPSAVNGPTITIRKGATKPLTLENLVQLGTLSGEMAEFLEACVQARLNIVVCGGVNSGRTTLLNVLSGAIPEGERIATIEDEAELRLNQRHVMSMVAPLASANGAGSVTLRDLVLNALRIRAERILLGECQGDEVVEMVKAMYNGTNGSMMALFANDLRSCLSRLEAMYLAAGTATPLSLIRTQIATALDVMVFISRLRDGSRKILNIAEVQGVEQDAIRWQSIFYYKGAATPTPSFMASGFCPTFLTRFKELDIALSKDMFSSKGF